MRSLLTASFALVSAVASIATAGCAAEVDNVDNATESTESLSAFGKTLIGNYHYNTAYKFYDTLSLASGGYSATFKPCPADAKCATHLETGWWSARASNKTLTLHPKGASKKVFHLSIAGDGSGMKISDGVNTEGLVFDAAAPVDCSSDADCASGEACRFVSTCPPAPPGGVTCMSGRNACVKVAGMGESCGFRTQTVACASGLDCAHVAGTPLDALTCTNHVAQYGETCGGLVYPPAQCADGLSCTHLNADGTFHSHPDAPGICRVALDGRCGGNSADARECAYPMHCESLLADLPGNCVN